MVKPMARAPLLFRACKGHPVRVVDPERRYIKCGAAARHSHQAVVTPVDDVSAPGPPAARDSRLRAGVAPPWRAPADASQRRVDLAPPRREDTDSIPPWRESADNWWSSWSWSSGDWQGCSSWSRDNHTLDLSGFGLEWVSYIGKGHYATVQLVREEDTGQTFVAKCVRLGQLSERDQRLANQE
ncbi:unnamed protein product, partial [Prorocentrum cordatum]